jgi:hypothetical protein
MEANLPECTRQRSFVQMVDGLHVISRRVLQLLNESLCGGVFSNTQKKNL